jgi:hypothetical protein
LSSGECTAPFSGMERSHLVARRMRAVCGTALPTTSIGIGHAGFAILCRARLAKQ